MSAIIDPLDRTTAVLFGDGAGAVLLEPAEPGFGLLDFYHGWTAAVGGICMMPAGGSLQPASAETVAAREHFPASERPDGVQVRGLADGRERRAAARSGTGLTTADVAVVIPHQANQRILDATADRLGLPRERMATVIARYGNTTAATLPLALEDVVRAGRLTRGDFVVFVAVGAGFTVGATLVRWGELRPVGMTGQARENSVRSIAARSSADSSSSAGPHAVQRVLHSPRTRNHDDRGRPRPAPRPAPARAPRRRASRPWDASTGCSGSLRLSRPPPTGL